jgi:hypothetical protein
MQGLPTDDYRKLLRPNRPSRQGKHTWQPAETSTTFTYPDKGRFISSLMAVGRQTTSLTSAGAATTSSGQDRTVRRGRKDRYTENDGTLRP